MKNFIYHFKFISGLYESYFYRQVNAEDEKEAIIQCASYFKDLDEESIAGYLDDHLGEEWTSEKFWEKMDTKFTNSDGSVGYTLLWIKETQIDLNTL